MASVFKRVRTGPIPKGATIESTPTAIPKSAKVRNGVASWQNRSGITVGGVVQPDGSAAVLTAVWTTPQGAERSAPIVPGTKRITTRIDPCYSAKYRDASGEWVRRSTETSDKGSAKEIANHWETECRKQAAGMGDSFSISLGEHSKRSIVDHLDEFIAIGAAKGNTQEHCDRTRAHVNEFIDAGRWLLITQIDAADVAAHVQTMRAAGSSTRTIQARLQSIKSFTRFLANHHRLRMNPLSMITKPDPKANRKHKRRMLTPDEWQWIEQTLKADTAPHRNGMDANERCILYRFAIQTGLRSSEIASLVRSKLVLDAKIPHVLCDAGTTKNRKPAKQSIDNRLAAELAEHVVNKHPQAKVFGITGVFELARTIQADAADARILWVKSLKPKERNRAESSDFLQTTNHDGEHLVFHSLRHSCGAWLALAGEHPKTVQTVMRHGSIGLTMDTYGHLFPGQAESAASKIGDMLNASKRGTTWGTTPTAGLGG